MDAEGSLMRCYSCDGVGAVDAPVPFDPVADRPEWPDLPCFLTDGCDGHVVPEALN